MSNLDNFLKIRNANSITTGTIDLARLPTKVKTIKVEVANLAALLALTLSSVQNGDIVYVVDIDHLFIVTDDTSLNNISGYTLLVKPNAENIEELENLFKINDYIIQVKGGAFVLSAPSTIKTDLALVKSDVGLGNVDNTSDINKPISTATQTALDDKVDKVSEKVLSSNDYTNTEKTDALIVHNITNYTAMSGIVAGGDIVLTGGINFDITAGNGYVRDASNNIVPLTWTGSSSSVPTAGDNFVYLDYTGAIVFRNNKNDNDNIFIGYITTNDDNTAILGFNNNKFLYNQYFSRLNKFIERSMGTLVEHGFELSVNTSPDTLRVTSAAGALWQDFNEFNIGQLTNFRKFYTDNMQTYYEDTSTPNYINNTHYNDISLSGTAALVPMTAGYYKKDLFFVSTKGNLFYQHGTSQYAEIEHAYAAEPPVVNPASTNVSVIGHIIIQEGNDVPLGIIDMRSSFERLWNGHYTKTELNAGQLNNQYYTESETDTLLSGKANTGHTHVVANITDLSKNSIGLGSVQNVDQTNASNITSGTLANARLSANLSQIGDETFGAGEIIQSFGGTLQNASLGVGNTGAIEITNSAGQILFDARYAKGPLNQKSGFFEDFITHSETVISPYLLRTVTGAGATTSIAEALSSGDTRNGVIVFSTGTSDGGSAGAASSNLSSINFANIPIGGYEEFGASFRIPILSNATQSFLVNLGFGDSPTGGIPTDGVYVSIGPGTTNMMNNNRMNNTGSSSGTASIVAATDYVVRIRVSNVAGVLASTFFLNGVSTGSPITLNMPSGAGRNTSIMVGISKFLGTTARTVELDWIYYESFKPRTINY